MSANHRERDEDDRSQAELRDLVVALQHRITELESTSASVAEANAHAAELVVELHEAREELHLKHAQLLQAQKLEAIGQLAAGIAHEINTPAQYVGDNLRFIQESFLDLAKVVKLAGESSSSILEGGAAPELAKELVAAFEEADVDYLLEEAQVATRQSLEGVDRVSKIVRAMKEFSHPGQGESSAVDINNAIRCTLTVATSEWKLLADVDVDTDDELPTVSCVPGEINQVLLNIIVNAAHAIDAVASESGGGKGRITISTTSVEEEAEIRISDTGSGIPVEARDRIFEPFFTTKDVGKGTGQGLAIAHDVIVNKHGGSLRFETELGKGTTFIIRLPFRSDRSSVEAA